MEKTTKKTIYVGLLKKDMTTPITKAHALNIISLAFKSVGVLGFNAEDHTSDIKGFWEGQQEDALKVSFLNTFNVSEKDFLRAVDTIKGELEQESVLIEEDEEVNYAFV